jgi:hypothetical protein
MPYDVGIRPHHIALHTSNLNHTLASEMWSTMVPVVLPEHAHKILYYALRQSHTDFARPHSRPTVSRDVHGIQGEQGSRVLAPCIQLLSNIL